jgi:hypothetical protein
VYGKLLQVTYFLVCVRSYKVIQLWICVDFLHTRDDKKLWKVRETENL